MQPRSAACLLSLGYSARLASVTPAAPDDAAAIAAELSPAMATALRDAVWWSVWFVNTTHPATLMALHRRGLAHWLGFPAREQPDPFTTIGRVTKLGVQVRSVLLGDCRTQLDKPS
jgi:hypothetical protein